MQNGHQMFLYAMRSLYKLINPFHATGLLPSEISENFWFSDVFLGGGIERQVGWNGFMHKSYFLNSDWFS